jgi:hypothetical protein
MLAFGAILLGGTTARAASKAGACDSLAQFDQSVSAFKQAERHGSSEDVRKAGRQVALSAKDLEQEAAPLAPHQVQALRHSVGELKQTAATLSPDEPKRSAYALQSDLAQVRSDRDQLAARLGCQGIPVGPPHGYGNQGSGPNGYGH